MSIFVAGREFTLPKGTHAGDMDVSGTVRVERVHSFRLDDRLDAIVEVRLPSGDHAMLAGRDFFDAVRRADNAQREAVYARRRAVAGSVLVVGTLVGGAALCLFNSVAGFAVIAGVAGVVLVWNAWRAK